MPKHQVFQFSLTGNIYLLFCLWIPKLGISLHVDHDALHFLLLIQVIEGEESLLGFTPKKYGQVNSCKPPPSSRFPTTFSSLHPSLISGISANPAFFHPYMLIISEVPLFLGWVSQNVYRSLCSLISYNQTIYGILHFCLIFEHYAMDFLSSLCFVSNMPGFKLLFPLVGLTRYALKY